MKTIRFIGPWGLTEQRAVRSALREVQQFIEVPMQAQMIARQWVCRCVRTSCGRSYCAHHADLDHDVQDPSFLGLLKKIYRLTWEQRDDRFAHLNRLFLHG